MIAAVLLAAGESTRMGQPKPMLPFGEGTLIEHLLRELVDSDIDRLFVVLGHEAERVSKLLAGYLARPVVNEKYKEGMLSSIRCGLKALPPETDTILLALIDQPGLSCDLIDALIAEHRDSGKGITVPVHDGRRGHPLIFSARYIDEILTDYDDTGLRGLLERHADDLQEVAVDDPVVLADVDTPEDYRRELERLGEAG